ncbi:hypothetical protein [Pseudonocardia phyllosphaerae]|uniref:hypothetical protein n=1 Tax=Pseudonocardia phyllosphaerae TaxID=3390502 RepID=UPI0039793C62
MWALLSRNLRVWLLLAIGAPILAWLLGKLGDAIEGRRGPNAFSKTLHAGRRFLERRTKGPMRRHDRHDRHDYDQLAR